MRSQAAAAVVVCLVVACGPTSSSSSVSPSPIAPSSPVAPAGLWPRSTPLAYDSTRGYVMLFGGTLTQGSAGGDTWIRKSGQWSQVRPKSSPPGRSGAVLVDDPEMHAVLLFGGKSASGQNLDDAWAWNGDDWVQLFPAHKPPARVGAACAFDPVRHVVLLFGGDGLNDTWTWNGQDWAEAKPAQSPPARGFARLAIDVANGEAVLFGGFEALRDTWTWDGSTWTQQHPSNTPPGFHEVNPTNEQLAYDSGRKVIVFAGPDEASRTTQTFEWTGSDWTQLHPQSSPPFRDGAGLAYDVANGVTIFAGGFAFGSESSDTTWGWDGTSWSAV